MVSFYTQPILHDTKGVAPYIMVWPSPGLPVARDLVGRSPDECLFDETATPQVGSFNSPAFLEASVIVNSVHAVVLLVNADVLLHATTCEAEASVTACADSAALVAVVPTTMVFNCNERDGRGALISGLLNNCLLEDQVYASVVIRAFSLAATGSASFVFGKIRELESRDVCSRVFGQGCCLCDSDWGGSHDDGHPHNKSLF